MLIHTHFLDARFRVVNKSLECRKRRLPAWSAFWAKQAEAKAARKSEESFFIRVSLAAYYDRSGSSCLHAEGLIFRTARVSRRLTRTGTKAGFHS